VVTFEPFTGMDLLVMFKLASYLPPPPLKTRMELHQLSYSGACGERGRSPKYIATFSISTSCSYFRWSHQVGTITFVNGPCPASAIIPTTSLTEDSAESRIA